VQSSAEQRAGEVYKRVVEEATAGVNTGLAAGEGVPPFLVRAFSLAEREDFMLDLPHLTTLEKVRIPSITLHLPWRDVLTPFYHCF
jgi:hypothetical protein